MSHKKLKLDGPIGTNARQGVMEIVGRGGPQTYVWIGEEGRGGKYFGAVNLDKLRKFIK